MTSSMCCQKSKQSQPYDQAYKGLHAYSLTIGLEVHPHLIETILKTAMGPDEVIFLDFYNRSVGMEGDVNMLGICMHQGQSK